jgi:hypothetical protein
MAKGIHKGTELNNVKETWNENERRGTGDQSVSEDATVNNDLNQTIKEEAAEYDRESNEEKLLGGDRATLNDE